MGCENLLGRGHVVKFDRDRRRDTIAMYVDLPSGYHADFYSDPNCTNRLGVSVESAAEIDQDATLQNRFLVQFQRDSMPIYVKIGNGFPQGTYVIEDTTLQGMLTSSEPVWVNFSENPVD